jgi:two-component sensor histidine kinase
LLNNVNQTASTLSKQVKLAFDWDNCYLDKNSLSALRESLTHLLNNSVDHGIEDSQRRLDIGKDAEGQILISGQDVDGWLRIQCLDDGAGFNVAKIRDVAIRKGICTVGEAMELTDEQVVDFLFHDNFSSAETVTEISGRGIGLSAVRKAMIELGGSAVAVMRGGGAVFEIRLPSDRSRPSRKREVPLVEVLGILEQEIEKLRQQGFDLAYELDSDLSDEVSDFMIYSESDAVIFAVIQLIHILSKEKQNKLLISKKTNGMLEVKMEGTLPQLTPSQKYILDSCVLYLQQHKGGIRLGEGVVVAKFGYLKQ